MVLVGLALYAVKVLQNPFMFTYADEWVHLHNVQSILATGRLFGNNTLLPVTVHYPGLEAATAAVVRASGMSAFAAGVVIIAAARTVMMLALFALYERLTGSPWLAGMGVLLYAATPTFLFFTSEFSYESLALPLATVALFALARRLHTLDAAARKRWATVVIVLDAAVVPTHHITSYVLFAVLVVVCLLHWLLRGRRGAPWVLAAIVGAMTAGWLFLSAGVTIEYIGKPLGAALTQVFQTLSQESPPRTLFVNTAGPDQTAVWSATWRCSACSG